jgi:hypothetical protein
MIKFGSYSTTLNVPFSEFYKEFNAELHFKLKGITKKWFNSITVEKNTPNYIRVWERKALHCNYYPDEQGNTVVEYTAEMTVFSLITWIIFLFFIVGFLFFPIHLLGNRFAASHSKKKVFKNGPSCILSIFSHLNVATVDKIKNQPINNVPLQNKTVVPPTIKNHSTPPPIKKSLTPPPVPKKTVTELYYVLINDQQKGPFTLEKIGLLIEVDQVTPTTLVWKEGMADWVNASAIETINFF